MSEDWTHAIAFAMGCIVTYIAMVVKNPRRHL